MKTREVVVATGDPQGIGPEISVRAVQAVARRHPDVAWVLVGDPEILCEWADPSIAPHSDPTRPGSISILAAKVPRPLVEPPPSRAGGEAALAALERALIRVRELPSSRALCTAPLSKEAVSRSVPGFLGHTDWLAGQCAVPRAVMLFVAGNLRVALATVHVPLADVPKHLSRDGLLEVLRLLDRGLSTWFGIEGPRISVLGLNPHAGEGGLLGKEEVGVIRPAVEDACREGLRVAGPFPADSFFQPSRLEDQDAVLAMYHDQGLLPVKCLAFGTSVNVSLGLPIVRTSVDHGCAFDLRASAGVPNSGSMEAALELAATLVGSRH